MKRNAVVAGFIAAVILMCSFSAHCNAQTKEIVHNDLTEFDSVDISHTFEATIAEGPYGVKVIVDNTLAPYVEVYVKGKTLYLGYDAKSVPADIKKMYKREQTRSLKTIYLHRLPKKLEVELGEKSGAVIMTSPLKTRVFAHASAFLLEKLSAPTTSIYGTMVEVCGLGVLFEGRLIHGVEFAHSRNLHGHGETLLVARVGAVEVLPVVFHQAGVGNLIKHFRKLFIRHSGLLL